MSDYSVVQINLNLQNANKIPFDLVVQSAVHDLSTCHPIVLPVGCNITVLDLRATTLICFGK